ncbi:MULTISPECIES: type IV pilin protein [Cupriavidus]|uniref:Type IV pilin protein n=1 Tax=Cupriavidus pauculus TaxID=82633 RepID=A0A5P2H837_9BURK|nr:type IV pilin protein [Cupriavidus pauculus]QET03794.1 type IV pilin protein [Cupriavidus pauculus]
MMRTALPIRRPRGARGFTLVELMITVMIIGVLATIAIPSYQQYVQRARRTEAKSAMLRLMGTLERYYTVNMSYTLSPLTLNYPNCGNNTTGSGDTCEASTYLITLAAIGDLNTGVMLSASPKQPDALCGTLTLNTKNQKTSSGTGSQQDCW